MFKKLKEQKVIEGFNLGFKFAKHFITADKDFEIQKKERTIRFLRNELELTRLENKMLKKKDIEIIDLGLL